MPSFLPSAPSSLPVIILLAPLPPYHPLCYVIPQLIDRSHGRTLQHPALLHRTSFPDLFLVFFLLLCFFRLWEADDAMRCCRPQIFRETLEASIIISILLSLAENLFDRRNDSQASTLVSTATSAAADGSELVKQEDVDGEVAADVGAEEQSLEDRRKRLIRRMKIQVRSFIFTLPPLHFSGQKRERN